MKKGTKKFFKSFIVMLIAFSMTLTSVPCTWSQIRASAAAADKTVAFKTSNYRKMSVGETYDFDLVNKPSGAKYVWSSSQKDVASVNKSGVVVAKKIGTTTITCKITKGDNTTALKAKVYVVATSKKPANSIKINNKISSMTPGERYDLNRTYSPKNVSDYVNWTSSNTNIATVDQNGVVTAKANGVVTIKAYTLNKKVKDTVEINVSNSVKASTQKDINRLLKAENASKITINTKKDVELTIPAGNYTGKTLVVNAPNATIENNGVFDSIEIQAIKPHTWKEKAKNNTIIVCSNASIIIDEGAVTDIICNRYGIDVTIEINGEASISVNEKCNLIIKGATKSNVKVDVNGKASNIQSAIPLILNLKVKVILTFTTKEAEKSIVTAENDAAIPEVKGDVSITVQVGNRKVIVTAKGYSDMHTESGSTGGSTGGGTNNPSNPSQPVDRITVDKNGLDKDGRVVAYFGSPDVDGEIDSIWSQAEPAKFVNVMLQGGGKEQTTTSATMKVLWDDNAIYFLAEVKDENVSDASAQVYEKDSVEFFLDQDNKRNGTYEGDDSQYRINFKNEVSSDHGDLTNLYSQAKVVNGGYIIEGRIALSVVPANETVMGMEGQINDATGATRIETLSIFDKSGTAYQDTSKFGEMVLAGKTATSVTKPNFYDLKSLVASAKKIDADLYVNGSDVTNLITQSEKAIVDPTATQAEYDELLTKLDKAVKALMHDRNKIPMEKECREIPKEYKATDPEEQRGSLQYVPYTVDMPGKPGETLEKSMMVYLPKGYDQADTSKKYNVFYLVHGMAENQFTPLGFPGSNNELMRVVDNLIADGKMEPMIIVSPTWYMEDSNAGMGSLDSLVKDFRAELVNTILPKIEGTYNCYAKSTSDADLKAARDHRAFGGFSMGGNCTWYRYIDSLDYFKYFVPVSMWTWVSAEECRAKGFTGETDNDVIAAYLASIPASYGYGPDDFYILGATGTNDLASPGMPNQFESMKKQSEVFKYGGDLRNSNTYFIHYPGGAHNWTCVNLYLYNILPDLFKTTWTDDYGLTKDENPTVVAKFGSPKIDGKVDAIWSEATPIIPKYVSSTENTTATFKTMWDDNALYVLATVKDENISKDATNPYEQDSMEVFLDERNDKTNEFGVDDLQFRINYANDTTADKGDILRLYSQTSTFDGGYLIEARIAWKDLVPVNDTKVGLELQINDGKGAFRAGTINVFDGTGNAWQNTAVFGNVVLKGKTDSVTVNPYQLLSLIDSVNKMNANEYVNWDDLITVIEAAKKVAEDKASTQAQIDEEKIKVQLAIDSLTYTEEAAKVKRFKVMPDEYKADISVASGGSIKRDSYTVTYQGVEITKEYNVYLPYGYSDEVNKYRRYNVFYLMHGGGENDTTLFGGEDQNLELKRILDNMIARGDMEPMIVVTPTFYNVKDENGTYSGEDIENFWKELSDVIIPKVEKEYNTYYDKDTAVTSDANKEEMKDTRMHRAFGGFSMGSACTWYTFINDLDYIKYYVPISGDCWALTGTASSEQSAETARMLSDLIKASDYNSVNGFKLFCATGSSDIAYPNMNPQMEELKKLSDVFIFNQDINLGNTYFMVADGGTHAWNFVNQYLYNILPDLFTADYK